MAGEIEFTVASASQIPGTPVSWSMDFDIPCRCPNCLGTIQPKPVSFGYLNLSDTRQFGAISSLCGACHHSFATYYHIESKGQFTEYLGAYPPLELVEMPSELLMISPRFVELHRQALLSTDRGHLELSAVGMLSALQLLVHDYIVVVLRVKEKKLRKMSCYQQIRKYLPKQKLMKKKRLEYLLSGHWVINAPECSLDDFQLLRFNYDLLCKATAKGVRKRFLHMKAIRR